MRSFVFSAVFALGSFVSADTLTVEGMHCSGCKSMITKSVCENEELAKTFEKCEVKVTDMKKQIGQIVVVPKADQKIDFEKVEAAVKAAGDYKVSKKETK